MAKVDTFKLRGEVLDARYRVESVVGEGGFGVVYRATQINFDEPVAIKVLKIPGHLNAKDSETFVQTFRNEGKHLRTLSAEHPAFVRAHDTGVIEVDGVPAPYLVLEWLDGEPLEDDLAARREQGQRGRPLQEALEIMEPIFGALAVAHTQRVAHRDIKPANIFITRNNKSGTSAKLLDFGMAKVMTTTGAQALHAATQGGLSGLTPTYAAPEQWDKKMAATGPWTDVYALALVLVELLTDHPALEGDDMPTLMSATLDEENRPTPNNRGATIPENVEAVFAKALSLLAKDRYLHAAEFWNALVEATEASAKAGVKSTLVKLDLTSVEVLQPSDVPSEARATSKTLKSRSKPGPVDAMADTAMAPDTVGQSVVGAKSQVAENRTTTAPHEEKGSSKRTLVAILLAAIVVVFVGWKLQNGRPVEATKQLDTAKPELVAEVPKARKPTRKWWEDLPDPSDPKAKTILASLPPARQKWLALRQQSAALVAADKQDEAISALRTARELACKELGESDGACVESLQMLAMLLAKMGKFEEAEKLLREAVALNEKYGDPEDEDNDDARQALVAVLVKQGKLDEAQKFLKPTDPPLPAPKASASTSAIAANGPAPKASASAAPAASASASAKAAASTAPTHSAAAAAPPAEDGRDAWTQIIDELHEEKTQKPKPAPTASSPTP